MSDIGVYHLIYRLDIAKKRMPYHNKYFESFNDFIDKEYEKNEEDPTETNLFFTVFKCSDYDRNKPVSTNFVWFDIDDIDVNQRENYVLALGGFLNVDPDEITVVFSGRGLQCYLKIDCEIGRKEFDFKKVAYRTLIHKFHGYCSQKGLRFSIDTNVYEAKRVLRYPNTINHNPGKKPEFCRSYVLQKGNLEKTISLEKLLVLAEYDENKTKEFAKSYKTKKGKHWADKKCIQKMWLTPIKEGDARHPIFLRLAVHEKHCGTSYEGCRKKIEYLCKISGLDPNFRGYPQLNSIYHSKTEYDFGCNDFYMKQFCSAVCYLHPSNKEKRKDTFEFVKSENSETLNWVFKNLKLKMTKNDEVHHCIDNVLLVMEKCPQFKDFVWFDIFHDKYFTKWKSSITREWSDRDTLDLLALFQRDLRFTSTTDETLYKAIKIMGHRDMRNEPLDWLKSLKWDGVKRVDDFFVKCLGCDDTRYNRAASANFMKSINARIKRPGCKVDTMVILEGGQGSLKSTFLNRVGGPWFSEANDSISSKDFYLSLKGKILIEIPELDTFDRAEVNTIKKVISCQTDRFRKPYERCPSDHPRSCVFAGTTNETHYLKDITGGRRFFPIVVKKINLSYIDEFRDQLFAEASHMIDSGEKWYEMPDEDTKLEQEARRQIDVWEEAISHYVAFKNTVSVMDIAKELFDIHAANVDFRVQKRITNALKILGFKNKVVRHGTKTRKVWELDEQ
jgi:predicted P-loop ATPase